VENVFKAIASGNVYAMKNLAQKLAEQIDDLVVLIRGDLDKHTRKKVNTLMILDMHARDIVDCFVRDAVMEDTAFSWESQMKFYWDRDQDTIIMKQGNGSFDFCYEYTGLAGRLVITPLTDRCYMTLTQALTMYLGGSPMGPAGTGKTETVKDLAKHLGRMCQVVNCSEGIDYKAMGNLLAGLCENGCWGCFDEFNRIEPAVLSVISAQIKTIQRSLQSQVERFVFAGREISILKSVGIFITMNPGYAGRTELPDNLKALFRPCVMVRPDMEMICENMLFSEGFSGARQLAKKMTVLYQLASEQLSKQFHYDFGLRALRSVLVMAGQLKRGSPDLDEQAVLMRALRDMNLPKFIYEDVPLFMGLIGDLFPGLDVPRERYDVLSDAIESVLSDDQYDVRENQVDKVVQLYETILARHAVMIVGPTGGGKSVVINTLAAAQRKLNLSVSLTVINPKAQDVLELYGVLNRDTREWTDGLLSHVFRQINQPVEDPESVRRYLVFDGDVDAVYYVWIESMNSVMDDNKMLTLPNGERIYLQSFCKLLFEVADLQYASPATISRCGMVWVDTKDLGYKPAYNRWARSRPDVQRKVFGKLFEKYCPPLIEYVCEGVRDGEYVGALESVIPLTDLNLISQLTVLLNNIFKAAERERDGDKAEGDGLSLGITDAAQLEAIFVFALVWSVGASLTAESRVKFDQYLKQLSGLPIDTADEAQISTGRLPAGKPTLYLYRYDILQSVWMPWEEYVTPFSQPSSGQFSEILVPTVDIVRHTYLLDALVQGGEPVMFVGESGTAKTTTIATYLRGLNPDKWVILTSNLSSRTSSIAIQRTLEDNLEKRLKNTYGPPPGRKLVFFVDELNMPRVDIYGTQQPVALLKLLIERNGLYERDKGLSWKTLLDVQSVTSMGTPGGGRNHVNPRFVTLFSTFNIEFPSDTALRHIYNSILSGHLESFPSAVQDVSESLTDIILSLYNSIVEALPPTPSRFHYVFNLRDMSRVYEAMCNVTPQMVSTPEGILKLFRNECSRVFGDRLINDENREFLNAKLRSLMDETVGHLALDKVFEEDMLYGDYRSIPQFLEAQDMVKGGEDPAILGEIPRLYEDLGSYEDMRPTLEGVLESYNESHKRMDLVLFDDAIEHLTRIYRILRTPRGNALLVGVGGSGRQSLTRLATFMAGYELFEIHLARNYGEAEFKEDLKTLYNMLGQENKEVTFLFTDQHVAEEGFLELLNNMLTTGMVPALFAEDEKEGIINAVRPEVIATGVFDSRDNCWRHFVDKCHSHLHIVLCMSPSGETLRQRCRAFPGFISNCTIDWFQSWSPSALTAVAHAALKGQAFDDSERTEIVGHMVNTHLTVVEMSQLYKETLRRENHASPKNYLNYLANYLELLKINRTKFDDNIARFENGLMKLVQAAEEVDRLQVMLKKQKVEVSTKTKACGILLDEISQQSAETAQKQEIADKAEIDLSEQLITISAQAEEAEAGLAAALPALKSAEEALNNLTRDDITEVRAFKTPPTAVQAVSECVCILQKSSDVSWAGAKSLMAQGNFIKSLVEFDKSTLTDRTVRKVSEYLKKKYMQPEAMEKTSHAGYGLLGWVIAMVNYYGVFKTVEPKKIALAKAQKQLAQSQKDLAQIKRDVERLQASSKRLAGELENATLEKKKLTDEADLMEKRLNIAMRLIAGLSTERVRWAEEAERLKGSRHRLVGDCLLLSGFLSYCGGFTFEYRQRLIHDTWHKDLMTRGLPVTEDFTLQELLTSDVEISSWAADGLPTDDLSIQNAILITSAARWPLVIDPQMQTINWIRESQRKNQLKTATFNDADFAKQLELSISYGTPYLFENVGEALDPMIDTVLEKNVTKVGTRQVVHFNDKDVEWDDNFRLFLVTKLANPAWGPDIFGKTSVVNHCVTRDGLETQLLNVVVQRERNDLEERRERLVHEMSENKSLLKQLEDTLLRELASSKGVIVDNIDLLNVLETTKAKASEISEKIEQMTETAKQIDVARNAYRAAAER
ncbi:dynein heavy chain, partial [Kipferlia bialata]